MPYDSTDYAPAVAPVIPDPYARALALLAAKPRRWEVRPFGDEGTPALRTAAIAYHCRIGAALDRPGIMCGAWMYGDELGMSRDEAFHFACVSDGQPSDPALRARMEAVTLHNQPPSLWRRALSTCGLSQPKGGGL